ncbi:MAG: hypothetical protein WC208_08000 [Gallionella sp.]|jgi:hypothetical protein
MRFFTDNFFTEAQKSEMLGSAYALHVKEQQKDRQLEQERQLRRHEAELKNVEWQISQQKFDRNTRRIGFGVLASIILFVMLSHGFGTSILSGSI